MGFVDLSFYLCNIFIVIVNSKDEYERENTDVIYSDF